MADDATRSSRIPWAGIAVLLAFIASTQLVPRAFDVLRPPEKERAQAPVSRDLPVDARLWEDPFVALRRYQAERDERCGKLGLDAAALQSCKGLKPLGGTAGGPSRTAMPACRRPRSSRPARRRRPSRRCCWPPWCRATPSSAPR